MIVAWDMGAAINAYCLLYILSHSNEWADSNILGVARIAGFSIGPILLLSSIVDNTLPLNITTIILLWSMTYLLGLNAISIYIKNRRKLNDMASLDSNRHFD